ncbi:TolC family protein (plasmid) [Sinorhizobium meliloti]|nr:TolC family protein [Sinorhizobium meliloti]
MRAAEARLRARLKGVDVTRASLYPTISLTSELGTSSPQLLGFISNPVGTLGANVALSFLNLKNSNLMVATSRQEYEKEVLDFRTTLLGAFSEVADALGARADDAERVRRHRNVLAAAQAIEHLQETSYRAGGINFKTWLDAQESRRAAEIALANVGLAQVLNESKLYRIIGGAVGKGAKSLLENRKSVE